MAVTKVVQKPAAKAAIKPQTEHEQSVAFRVDRMVELGQIIDDLKPQVEEYEEHKKALAQEANGPGFDIDKEVRFDGTKGFVLFGPAPQGQQLVHDVKNLKKLHELLGDRFYAVVKVGITDLKTEMSSLELEKAEKLMTSTVGSRRLKGVKPTVS